MKMKMTHELNTSNFRDELKKSAEGDEVVLFSDFLSEFLMHKENATLLSVSLED